MYSRAAARCDDPGTPKSSHLMTECSLTFTQSAMASLEFGMFRCGSGRVPNLRGRELLDNESFDVWFQ